MTQDEVSRIQEALRKMLPRSRVEEIARRSGAVQRERKVDIVVLVWTLVLGFGGGAQRTLAGLRRQYEAMAEQTIEESAFYKRFSGGLVSLLKELVVGALDEKVLGVGRALVGPLAAFKDVILTDSTVLRLRDFLAGQYPATRTNHTKAALKTHIIVSVGGAGKQSVKITPERAHDSPVLKIGPWVADHLLLFDLGYFRYGLFDRITHNKGLFVSRLKANANPTIVRVNRVHRGRAIDLVGNRLHAVVDHLDREILDVNVEVRFQHRTYAGRARSVVREFRVIGQRNDETGAYHLYVTNVPPEKLAAEDIGAVYALRWKIEMLFKELKQHYRLDDLPSKNPHVVEALIYASILTMIVSRQLLALVRSHLGARGSRTPDLRWATIFAGVAPTLLAAAVRPLRNVYCDLRSVLGMLLHEAVDPNRKRRGLLEAVEQRAHRIHPFARRAAAAA